MFSEELLEQCARLAEAAGRDLDLRRLERSAACHSVGHDWEWQRDEPAALVVFIELSPLAGGQDTLGAIVESLHDEIDVGGLGFSSHSQKTSHRLRLGAGRLTACSLAPTAR